MIQVLADITHRPQTTVGSAFDSQLSQSLQRTIEDHLREHGLQEVIRDPPRWCFILSTPTLSSIQENVGKHVTIIDSIKVTVPYSYCSVKEPMYGADITVYYQQRTDGKVSTEADTLALVNTRESGTDGIDGLDDYMTKTVARLKSSGDIDGLNFLTHGFDNFDLRSQRHQDIFSPRPVSEPISLDLEICKSFVVLKVIPLADKKTIDRLTTVFMQKQSFYETEDIGRSFLGLGAVGGLLHMNSLKYHRSCIAEEKNHYVPYGPFPPLNIKECRDYKKAKDKLTARARRNGLIACSIALGTSWLLWNVVGGGPTARIIVTAIMVFLTGPLGAIAGFL